ncbi:MAG: GNAT family N-acetyltransferase [Candidatus Hodarchaeota archaeon]
MTQIKTFRGGKLMRVKLLNALQAVDQDFLPPLSQRKPLEFWISLFEKGTILIAIEEEKAAISGFLAYYPSLNGQIYEELRACVNLGPVLTSTDTHEVFQGAYLHFIAVTPEFRGKEVGSLLMKALLDDAQRNGISQMRVITWSTNVTSLNLYRKYGFQIFKQVPNDRGSGVGSVYLEAKFPFPLILDEMNLLERSVSL